MTKTLVGVIVLLGACATLPGVKAGGKAAFDDVVKQMLETMDSLTTTLATVRDEESAKAARPELRKAAAKWQGIETKAKNVPPPNREEKDRLAKQYKTKLEEAQKKLFGEVARRPGPGRPGGPHGNQ